MIANGGVGATPNHGGNFGASGGGGGGGSGMIYVFPAQMLGGTVSPLPG